MLEEGVCGDEAGVEVYGDAGEAPGAPELVLVRRGAVVAPRIEVCRTLARHCRTPPAHAPATAAHSHTAHKPATADAPSG